MNALAGLASLFEYPDDGYAARARANALVIAHPALEAFATAVERLTVTELQERFIESFDLNPSATLEIGWHIFGEQYERGELLVTLRRQLREAGIPETTELPDHLVHVLPLVGTMAAADSVEFTTRYLAPALTKIAGAVPAGSPFADLIGAVREVACGPAVSKIEGTPPRVELLGDRANPSREAAAAGGAHD